MRKLPPFVHWSLLLTPALGAQVVAGAFAPNPAAPGVPITFTGTDALGQGLNLPSPCGWYRIHQGSQTGPIVPLPGGCLQVIVPIAPNGTFSFTWDQRDATGQFVPPGTYWYETRVWDQPLATLHVNWFCISIQPAGAPALTAAGPARVGQTTPLQITAPGQGSALWIVACSLDSNTPLSVFGLDTCLSLPLFFEPFTTPLGVLDAGGSSTGLALVLPNAPQLLWQGLHVQSVILGAVPVMTNDVSFTIQP
jgi:hypothetical protein